MSLFDIVACLLTLAAGFGYINHRFLKLPRTIGLMLIALVMSLVLVALGGLGLGFEEWVRAALARIDFNDALMNGMLSFLLFAGALHVDINDLSQQKWVVATLATVGVLVSTFIVGGLGYLLFNAVGLELPLIYCLVFGALISPTDPIAVLGILKTAGAPKRLETKITGESLFNDGVGVVVFVVMLGIAVGADDHHGAASVGGIAVLFLQEAVGGAVFGLVAGYVAYRMLKSIDTYQIEVLITLALVAGGYALASALHISGPIAVVVAGLLIGNQGRVLAMSDVTRDHLDKFWELVDEILNAVLFVMIGLEILLLEITPATIVAGLLAIVIVLFARFVSVGVPITIMRRYREFTPSTVVIMTWGGLRGGISVALALALPKGELRDTILAITYAVVVFSILVQGLSIGPLMRRLLPAEASAKSVVDGPR